MPGTIKKPEHFLRFLRKIVKCLKDELKEVHEAKIVTPLQLFNKMQSQYFIDQRPLRHTRTRLSYLLGMLRIKLVDIQYLDNFISLNAVVDFATLLSTYYEGFTIIAEPFPEENRGTASRGLTDPLL